jgi:triacylglycerol lipase
MMSDAKDKPDLMRRVTETPAAIRDIVNLFRPDSTFPYFKILRDRPFQPLQSEFSRVNATWAAHASMLIYNPDEDLLERSLESAGFSNFERILSPEGSRCDTNSFMARAQGWTLVCFRGTSFLGDQGLGCFKDLFTDLKFLGTAFDTGGQVHRGFLEALNDVWLPMGDILMKVIRDHPGHRVWLTGHSMGAALATLAAARLARETGPDFGGVYTFGSPRAGDEVFTHGINWPVSRVVHAEDVITQLPMKPLMKKNPYDHAGQYIGLRPDGSISLDPGEWQDRRPLVKLGISSIGSLLSEMKPDGEGSSLQEKISWIVDHAPIRYVQALEKALVR